MRSSRKCRGRGVAGEEEYVLSAWDTSEAGMGLQGSQGQRSGRLRGSGHGQEACAKVESRGKTCSLSESDSDSLGGREGRGQNRRQFLSADVLVCKAQANGDMGTSPAMNKKREERMRSSRGEEKRRGAKRRGWRDTPT
eukprot:754694-Hanusia_phi.AAC.13